MCPPGKSSCLKRAPAMTEFPSGTIPTSGQLLPFAGLSVFAPSLPSYMPGVFLVSAHSQLPAAAVGSAVPRRVSWHICPPTIHPCSLWISICRRPPATSCLLSSPPGPQWKPATACGETIRGCGTLPCEAGSRQRSFLKQPCQGSSDKLEVSLARCWRASKLRHSSRQATEKPDWAYQDKQATMQTQKGCFVRCFTQTRCFLLVVFKHGHLTVYQAKIML